MKINEKLDIRAILTDLENYRPRRKGWVWRDKTPIDMGPFHYVQASAPLKKQYSFTKC